MHHYRQALLRMRQGESDREIAAARLMGRRKAGQWRELAVDRGSLTSGYSGLRFSVEIEPGSQPFGLDLAAQRFTSRHHGQPSIDPR